MKATKMTTAEKIRNLQMVKVTGCLPPEIEAEYLNPELHDEENPEFMFQGTWTSLLTRIAKGEVDAEFYARKELANRGLDLNGNWIGFEAAAREHKV